MGIEVIVLFCLAIGITGQRVAADWVAGVTGKPLPSQVRRDARRAQREIRYQERVRAAQAKGRPAPSRTPARDYASDVWAMAWEDVGEWTRQRHDARKERPKTGPGPVRKGIGAWMERKVKAPFRERATKFAAAQVAKLSPQVTSDDLSDDKPSKADTDLSENKSGKGSRHEQVPAAKPAPSPTKTALSKMYDWHCRGCARMIRRPERPGSDDPQCCHKGWVFEWSCDSNCTHRNRRLRGTHDNQQKQVRTYYHCTKCGRGKQIDGHMFQEPESECCYAEMMPMALCSMYCEHNGKYTGIDESATPPEKRKTWWHCPMCGAVRYTLHELEPGKSKCCDKRHVKGLDCTDQCIHAPADLAPLSEIAAEQEASRKAESETSEDKPAEDEKQDSPVDEPGDDQAEETDSEAGERNESPMKEDNVSNTTSNAPVAEITNLDSLRSVFVTSVESLRSFAGSSDVVSAAFENQEMRGKIPADAASGFEDIRSAITKFENVLAGLGQHQTVAEAVNSTPDTAKDTKFYKSE